MKKQTNKQKYGRWNFLKLKYIFEHIGLYGLSAGVQCDKPTGRLNVVLQQFVPYTQKLFNQTYNCFLFSYRAVDVVVFDCTANNYVC